MGPKLRPFADHPAGIVNARDDLGRGLLVIFAVLAAIAWRERREPRLLRYIYEPAKIERLRRKGYAVRRIRTATGRRAILRSTVPVR
jgi:hypothetical protein